ncbi:MAG: purine-nucleoside phosphorylase [Deltaproteobacteria bacterium]|nr:purine-nucleoside phosphorylase [Deltaproteobacteria bacterium]
MISQLKTAARFLESRFGEAPEVGVVLGSGLSAFTETLHNTASISTQEIPGGVISTVQGHSGKLVVGKVSKNSAKSVAVLAGRIHGYEGNSPHQVVHNLRAMRLWGIKKFILTNATGSTKKTFKPGSLVLISDHINFTCQSPLTGKELFEGERFPDMSDAYSKAWRKAAKAVAQRLKIKIQEGVYGGVLGPSFETPAEIKMFAQWGASIVGMSTVWETIALKQMGAEILGISCVTNFGTGVTNKPLSHREVLETTKKSQKTFNLFVSELLQK